MRRKAGLHKRVSSIFEDLHVRGLKDDIIEEAQEPQEAPPMPPQQEDPPTEEDISQIDTNKEVETFEPEQKKETPFGDYEAQKQSIQHKVRVVKIENDSAKKKHSNTKYQIVAAGVGIVCLVTVGMTVKILGAGLLAGAIKTQKESNESIFAQDESLARIGWQIPDRLPDEIRDIMSASRSEVMVYQEDEKIVVKGILYSKDQPSAIIGIQIVHVGDEIMGAKIAKITRNAVEFEKDGEMWEQAVER